MAAKLDVEWRLVNLTSNLLSSEMSNDLTDFTNGLAAIWECDHAVLHRYTISLARDGETTVDHDFRVKMIDYRQS
jgi:hypothetical protein